MAIDASPRILALAHIDAVFVLDVLGGPDEHVDTGRSQLISLEAHLGVARARGRDGDTGPVRLEDEAHAVWIAVGEKDVDRGACRHPMHSSRYRSPWLIGTWRPVQVGLRMPREVGDNAVVSPGRTMLWYDEVGQQCDAPRRAPGFVSASGPTARRPRS